MFRKFFMIGQAAVKCTKKIINISSRAANIGATYPYRLTKWDVTGLVEACEKYAKKNILINSVAQE